MVRGGSNHRVIYLLVGTWRACVAYASQAIHYSMYPYTSSKHLLNIIISLYIRHNHTQCKVRASMIHHTEPYCVSCNVPKQEDIDFDFWVRVFPLARCRGSSHHTLCTQQITVTAW